ncbi:hypothetical protein HOA92_04910 [archaeon]|nr:hypothetical protein [archaeon]MBT6762358.1 hypothetical protein [archaeon]
MRSNKGQVTVFIILGLVLVAIFGLFLYFTGSVVEDEITSAARPVTESVPSEFIAIQEYTETCLYSTAKEGLIILGQQGGYLYPDTVGEYSLSDPTNSDGINLDSLSIPYWHYNSNPNGQASVEITSLKPSLDDKDDYYSVASQLGRYVDEEIEDCLNGYSAFVDQEFTVDYSAKDTSVRIFDGELDFTLVMPLTATRAEAISEMTTFYTDVELNFKDYYEVASELADSELEHSFLENQLLELINIHSRLDSDALPPLNSMLILTQPEHLSWNIASVSSVIKSMLSSHVPSLRYAGNSNFHQYEYESELLSDLYQQIYDNSVVPLASNSNSELISFSYLNWDPHVDLNGGEDVIEGDGFFVSSPLNLVPFSFGYQQYYNSYDISYPVLVTVSDADAFSGQGYTLNFAMESNLINNAPMDADFEQSAPVVSPTANSLLCDPIQRNSELVSTIIIDSFTNEPVSDVFIGLKVPGFDFCSIGETDGDGELETSYPLLYGGELELSLDGYASTSYQFDSYLFEDVAGIYGYAVAGVEYDVLEIYPLKEVQLEVEALLAKKCIVPKSCNEDDDVCLEDETRICFNNGEAVSGLFLGTPDIESEANGSISFMNEFYFTGSKSQVDERMQITVIMTRVSGIEDEVAQIANSVFTSFTGGEEDQEAHTVELVPGIYSVETFVIMEDNLLIYDDERCLYDEDGKGDCNDVPGITSPSYLAGGYKLDDESMYIEITEEDLYLSDTLTLFVPVIDFSSIPSTIESPDHKTNDVVEINSILIEDFMVSTMLWDYIDDKNNVRNLLEPEWSSSLDE